MANWIDTIWHRHGSAPVGRRDGGWRFGSLAARLFDTIYVWQSRADRRTHLLEMDDRMLEDIGIGRSQAEAEAGKPFWAA